MEAVQIYWVFGPCPSSGILKIRESTGSCCTSARSFGTSKHILIITESSTKFISIWKCITIWSLSDVISSLFQINVTLPGSRPWEPWLFDEHCVLCTLTIIDNIKTRRHSDEIGQLLGSRFIRTASSRAKAHSVQRLEILLWRVSQERSLISLRWLL
jgi:hypothetical protein